MKCTSCRGSILSLKTKRVSNDVKEVLLDITNDKFNEKLFDKLLTHDQRIVSNFVRTIIIKYINLDSFDEKYEKEYQIILGELIRGNRN